VPCILYHGKAEPVRSWGFPKWSNWRVLEGRGLKPISLVTFGLLQGRVIAVVHTEREDYTRIFSARKATKYEQRVYFQQLSN